MRGRILIVDDDRSTCELLEESLQRSQFDPGREQPLDGQVVVFHDQDAPPMQFGQAVGPAFDQQAVAGTEKGGRAGSQSVLLSA